MLPRDSRVMSEVAKAMRRVQRGQGGKGRVANQKRAEHHMHEGSRYTRRNYFYCGTTVLVYLSSFYRCTVSASVDSAPAACNLVSSA